MQSVGQYIRVLRNEKGCALQDVASYLELAPDLLDKIERGKRNITKGRIFDLAGYFEVNENDLLVRYQEERILSELHNSKFSERIGRTRQTRSTTGNHPDLAKRHQNMIHELSRLRERKIQVKAHKPAYPLSLYIENIIYCDGHNLDYGVEKVMPDGTVQLIIELDEQQRFLTSQNNKPVNLPLKTAWVTGIQKQQLTYHLEQNGSAIYVRFRPGGFYVLTHIPQSEMVHAAIDAGLLLGSALLRLREELINCDNTGKMFQKIENYFFAKMKPQNVQDSVISYSREHIHQPLSHLVHKTGYSQKHLIALFKKYIGVTPKYFQRICRFKKVLVQIHTQKNKMDWSEIVYDHNYFDQAHFIKEFRHFSGISPKKYLDMGSTCSRFSYSHI